MSIVIDDRTNRTSPEVYGPAIGGHPWCIILHHDGDGGVNSEEGTIRYLSYPHPNPVSTHKFFRRNGVIVKIVPEYMVAWHAGWSRLGNRDGCNSGLGYEIANTGLGTELYTNDEYESVALSVVYDCAVYHIPDSLVSSHHIVADNWVRAYPVRAKLNGVSLGRKTDPLAFDWARLWRRVDQIRANWPKEFAIPPWWNNIGPRVMHT